ncbi:TonB-dependent receptor [Reichenbachiella carrageenanivorans]|uniref:TonB-dependent receptor n=1 Tax=Reichenbachiella carrageenanivorans TaxID=2979869 RepID=A0ABY6DB80_9BACT|nr:TonB-dependent receptor family protein [Reichenbachiella carrageenanivorans]UXX81095.1 TonB-dependent receptor [Reichenbachiella carrageenanivorans]
MNLSKCKVCLISSFIILFGVARSHMVMAQSAKVTVSGQLIDENGEGVPFSNVAFLSLADSTMIGGTVTDFEGVFHAQIETGVYNVRLSYIGYHTEIIPEVSIAGTMNMGKIALKPDVQRMEEVVIESSKYEVEVKPGSKIFNVANTPAAESSNAVDLLQTVPSAGVNMDDEITFRGRKVAILIDGVETDVVNILEQIPASEIESIEVISNPSAKYNTKNGESIINIILKKNKDKEGVNANATVGVGSDGFKKIDTGLKWSKNKFEIGGNANMKLNNVYDEGRSFRTSFNNDTTQTDQLYKGSNEDFSRYYRLYSRYRFTDSNLLQVSLATSANHVDREKDYEVEFSKKDAVTRYSHRTRKGDEKRRWFRGDIFFKQMFRDDQDELRLRGKMTHYDRNEEYVFIDSLFFADESFNRVDRKDQINDHISNDNEYRFSADYERILSSLYSLESGVVARLKSAERAYLYNEYNDSTQSWVMNQGRSNDFLYNETEYGGYLLFKAKWAGFEALSYSLGMRATYNLLDPQAEGVAGDFVNQFWNFLPSAQFAYQVDDTQSVSLNFSRKNKNPAYYRLNPYVTYYSPTSISYGNPFLKPEMINALELGYDKMWDGDRIYWSNSVYYKTVEDAAIRYRFEDENEVVNFTYENVDAASSMGWEMITNFKMDEHWKINTSINLYNSAYTTYNNSQELIRRRGSNFTSKSSLEYKNPIGFSGQLQMNYFSEKLTAQGYDEPFYYADLVMRQKLVNDQLTVSLRVSDIFNTWRRNSVVDQSDSFASENYYSRNSYRCYFSVSYQLSKLTFKNAS